MHFGRILEGLWDGRIRAMDKTGQSALCTLLRQLLPVDAVCLSDADVERGRITVLGDDCPVAPELPLGDVLAEELDIDVANTSLVFLVPAPFLDASISSAEMSRSIGEAVARAIVHFAERGLLVIEHEIGTIRALAAVYSAVAGAPRFAALGLRADPFRAGLVSELQALFGWAILGTEAPEPQRVTTDTQKAFAHQIEALAACGRTVSCDLFTDLATHLAANDAGVDAGVPAIRKDA